jgi:hypothetical protein
VDGLSRSSRHAHARQSKTKPPGSQMGACRRDRELRNVRRRTKLLPPPIPNSKQITRTQIPLNRPVLRPRNPAVRTHRPELIVRHNRGSTTNSRQRNTTIRGHHFPFGIGLANGFGPMLNPA